jgi:beta-glucosidase
VEHLSVEERMIKLLDAGIDQFGGETIPEVLVGLVESGRVDERRLDQSVRRLMLDKLRLGLFDDPYVEVSQADAIVGRSDFVAAGKDAQRRSVVLLKNGSEQPVLPLSREPVERPRIYVENLSADLIALFGEVVDEPTDADFAIIRIETPYYPHEGLFYSNYHSGDLDFKAEEKERLLTLMETVPTIVDLYLDRAAVVPEIAEKSVALIVTFGVTDKVLVEVLAGDHLPTGRLPFEMPRSMNAVEAQYEDVPHDSENPLFPFGHGLSYSQ